MEGATSSWNRITCLTLQEHDDDDDDQVYAEICQVNFTFCQFTVKSCLQGATILPLFGGRCCQTYVINIIGN